ncbi:hypothetical protein HOY82DRAFT_615846 [Tuber indicum]|nr:hypothetical protein HOY82DRAFT_615846 [Tuber indicum]
MARTLQLTRSGSPLEPRDFKGEEALRLSPRILIRSEDFGFSTREGTLKMSKPADTVESISLELAKKTCIRSDLLEDVNDQTMLFHAHKKGGSYKNREESHKSKQWLDLVALREKLDDITIEVMELREKLKKLEAAGGN